MKFKYSIAVMGAGGTGSYFLKEVSRQIAASNEIKKQLRSLYICDGDIVEEKNLERQCFLADDIGRAKACVLAEVLNESFLLNWAARPSYVEALSDLEALFPFAFQDTPGGQDDVVEIPVIIGCVDNHGARLLFEEFFQKATNCIYFDAGNEFETGETVFSYKLNGKIVGPPRSHYFPDIKEGDTRNRGEISCTELNQVSPQHIYTNMLAGLTLCSAFSSLMQNKLMPGVVFFNSHSLSSEFIPYKE